MNYKVRMVCEWCGNGFEIYKCKLKYGRGKYCSRTCNGKASGQRQVENGHVFKSEHCKGKNNINWQGGGFRDCIICGDLFWRYPSRKQETCSVECGYKRATLVRLGKLNSLDHRGSYNGISSWGRIRKRILERDNYICQKFCGHIGNKNNNSFLHVHHIKKISDGGLSEDENLITFCQDCHMRIHNVDRITNLKEERRNNGL